MLPSPHPRLWVRGFQSTRHKVHSSDGQVVTVNSSRAVGVRIITALILLELRFYVYMYKRWCNDLFNCLLQFTPLVSYKFNFLATANSSHNAFCRTNATINTYSSQNNSCDKLIVWRVDWQPYLRTSPSRIWINIRGWRTASTVLWPFCPRRSVHMSHFCTASKWLNISWTFSPYGRHIIRVVLLPKLGLWW